MGTNTVVEDVSLAVWGGVGVGGGIGGRFGDIRDMLSEGQEEGYGRSSDPSFCHHCWR